ncbi:MAG: hypothetical protein GY778_29725 [bacterium]|nr:hypothetical protein [bacterium]
MMTSTTIRQRRFIGRLLVAAACTVPGPAARADVGPPVKITMPLDAPQAVSGEVYEGVFEVHVGRAGTLANFELDGAGWTVLSLDVAADPLQVEAGVVLIPFSALPADADRLIRMSLTHDGRLVSRSLRIGPAAFARRGKDRPSVQVSPIGRPPGQADHAPPIGVGEEETEPDGSMRGGGILVHFTGRIVYDRPTAMMGNTCGGPPGTPTATAAEGVHGIWVQVMDDDTLVKGVPIEEEIWSGHTDENGFFDSEEFLWDDCDVLGCDEPDLYIRYELDTDIVNVQDPSDVLEPEYSWGNRETGIIDDWGGGDHDFGTRKPGDPADMPAMHIHNSITRAHLFVKSRVGTVVPEVDVLWPDGNNASYLAQEIKIGPPRQWNEGTHTHEYGHHFLENYAVNVEPDYCNADNGDTSFCDDGSGVPNCYGTPTGSCGHCPWCRETDHDAWNEGWPNWLGDVVTRSYPDDYQFSDCTPWTAMCPRSQESISNCCQDNLPHDALLTEGFVGALLRDIEDDTQDDHDGDGTQDSLCLGVDEIFSVAMTYPEPITVAEFLSRFLIMFPLEEAKLWPTAFNVDPSYVSGVGFGADAALPGVVTAMYSPTHPIGVGGPLPCITVVWQHAPDDVPGVCAYSYKWSQIPTGDEPGTTAATDIDYSGCSPSVTSGPFNLADWYISIRAQDCLGNWSTQWNTLGPFTVTECNSNGILDACEVACDISTLGLPCGSDPSYCTTFWPVGTCGQAQDCNTNFVPDDCDMSSGSSPDCNNNDRPDECDQTDGTLIQWVGGFSSSWHDADNWHKPTSTCPPSPADPCQETEPTCPALPTTGDDVCIDDPNVGITVVYSDGTTQVNTLACSESLTIDGSASPWPELELDEPSFINGNLTLSGVTTLTVNDTLDVFGILYWNDRWIRGPGETNVYGGFDLNPADNRSQLFSGHHLSILGGAVNVHNDNWVEMSDTAVFTIGPGVTYTYNGDFNIVTGGTISTFDNDGTVIRASGDARATILGYTDNSGLIHVQTGELYTAYSATHTGEVRGAPGTTLTFATGTYDFLPSSNLNGDDIGFLGGATVRGDLDIADTLTIDGSPVTFTNEANVTSFGQHLFARSGTAHFDVPTTSSTIPFDTVLVGEGNYGCTVHFDSGQSVLINSLTMHKGGIDGADAVTISGSFVWGTGGGIFLPPRRRLLQRGLDDPANEQRPLPEPAVQQQCVRHVQR